VVGGPDDIVGNPPGNRVAAAGSALITALLM